jgi:pimeloyl-ACP methyl ester carboxylesterase
MLIHGLWMNGMELGVLRRRLQHEYGFDVHTFSYPTLHGDLQSVCADLASDMERTGAPRVHAVAHSLGGAVLYRALQNCNAPLTGNAVLLASPLAGCKAAEGVSRHPWLRGLIGPHVLRELAGQHQRSLAGVGSVGAIAGSRRLGTGQFFAHFDEANDGTVAVRETLVPGLTDHIVLPHSHIGMLFAEDVARQVAHFLRCGSFKRDGLESDSGRGAEQ